MTDEGKKQAHSNNVMAMIVSWITLIRAASPPTFPTAGEGKNLGSPSGGAVGVSRLRGGVSRSRPSPPRFARHLGGVLKANGVSFGVHASPWGRGKILFDFTSYGLFVYFIIHLFTDTFCSEKKPRTSMVL